MVTAHLPQSPLSVILQHNTRVSGVLPDDVFATTTALQHLEFSNTRSGSGLGLGFSNTRCCEAMLAHPVN